jgi:lipid A 3-O-deacylase
MYVPLNSRRKPEGPAVITKRKSRLPGPLAFFIFLLVVCSPAATAQNLGARSLQKGAWDLDPFAGGGDGVASVAGTDFFVAGGRAARVMTHKHLSGIFRGDFEFGTDIMPAVVIHPRRRDIYGGSFAPIIKWNFTSFSRFTPYVLFSGGGLATTSDIPPGRTSRFNVMAGGSVGSYIFLRRRGALTFELRMIHISNANIGIENPQYPVSAVVTTGYTWFF